MNARLHLLLLLKTSFALLASLPANGQDTPVLIVIDNAPFKDVIRNLATQADLNLIMDPRVEGKPVSIRWENLTPRNAMDRLLKEQGYTAVYSPATTVCRIVGTNVNAKPVAADQIHGATNEPSGLIVFDDTPLVMAIMNLSRQAGLQVEIAPELTEPTRDAEGKFVMPPNISVSVRWRNLSATQALAALLDNYELTATKDASTGIVRIAPKPSPGTVPPDAQKSIR